MLRLVLSEILVVFFKRLTPDGKYPVQDCENLEIRMEMQLFEKRKTSSELSVIFPKSTLGFKHFLKKDDFHS